MRKRIWIMVLAMMTLAACSPVMQAVQEEPQMPSASGDVVDLEAEAPASGYIEVEPLEAQKLMEETPNLVIIDVSPSYDNGHLPGAVSIPLSELPSRLGELDPANPHLVYCHSDTASIRGAEILVENGFSPVYRLEGNYSGWVDAGLPVEK